MICSGCGDHEHITAGNPAFSTRADGEVCKMNANLVVKLDLNVDESKAFIEKLSSAFFEFTFEIRKAFIDRFNALDEPFCIEVDNGMEARAGEIWLLLKPSNSLSELVAAFRTGDLNAL